MNKLYELQKFALRKHLLGESTLSRSERAGFTLTELIVVIVIIAALALILIPNMLKMMPDDHNIKYKKAFYTIHEIVNNIASECQGLYYDSGSGQWYTIEEWNSNNPGNQKVSEDNVLSYCYKDDKTHKQLGQEICERLNVIDNCNTYYNNGNGYYWNVLTTNGMKWTMRNTDIANGSQWGIVEGNRYDIYVSFDGVDVSDVSNLQQYRDKGVYVIRVNSLGKVVPVDVEGITESDLLLNSPTKD